MTENDLEWFVRCHRAGLVNAPFLEVGSARVNGVSNLCDAAKKLGMTDVVGVDLGKGEGVDLVRDFGMDRQSFSAQVPGKFSTVCVFNVLEHTFDPVVVLSNALECLAEHGTLLVVTPAIWPLHSYPGDYNRLLPDWYREFSRYAKISLLEEHFCWLSQFGMETVSSCAEDFPTFLSRPKAASFPRYWASRILHRAFNTYGRSHWATYSAIGAAFAR